MFHEFRALLVKLSQQKKSFSAHVFAIKGQKEKQGKEEADPCQWRWEFLHSPTGIFSIPPSVISCRPILKANKATPKTTFN